MASSSYLVHWIVRVLLEDMVMIYIRKHSTKSSLITLFDAFEQSHLLLSLFLVYFTDLRPFSKYPFIIDVLLPEGNLPVNVNMPCLPVGQTADYIITLRFKAYMQGSEIYHHGQTKNDLLQGRCLFFF